jgi:hypothetical protein
MGISWYCSWWGMAPVLPLCVQIWEWGTLLTLYLLLENQQAISEDVKALTSFFF